MMMRYVGRFAPSPTGPLHFGSLVAALASYCDAKANCGKWLLRIEDLDKPREMKGASQDIIETLVAFGFEWDGEIIYQSQRLQHYQTALNALDSKNLIYPCSCSRKEIADSSSLQGIEGAIYPKKCLHHPLKNNASVSIRIKTPNETISFNDCIQGEISQNLAADIGDFVLLRADKVFAYQLAVVVDDEVQNITHIVRGADLLQSTPRQIFLQKSLEFAQPKYAHIPFVGNAKGEKLSKQTLAAKIDHQFANQQLYSALLFLGQNPPANLAKADKNTILEWAITHWDMKKVSKKPSQLIND